MPWDSLERRASDADIDWDAVMDKLRVTSQRLMLEAAQEHSDFRTAYLAGNDNAVMWAIALAAVTDEKIPGWAATAFVEKFYNVTDHQAESWDEVFGKPHPPRTNFKAVQKWKKLAWPIYDRVEILKSEGVPIDKALETVASENHISASTARDYYYRYRREHLFPF